MQTPLLIRESSPAALAERHQARLRGEGITVSIPRKWTALNGMAMVGLVIEQQEALLAALVGSYPQTLYGDDLPRLREAYPSLMPVIENDSTAGKRDMATAFSQIIRVLPSNSPDVIALSNLYRAWLVWRGVVIEGQPLDLTLPFAEDFDGDILSFTPIVQRCADGWVLGRTGDIAPVSPRTFPGEADVWSEILATLADWREKDEAWWAGQYEDGTAKADHYALRAWAAMLRREGEMLFGKMRVENISHGEVYRFYLPDGKRILVRSYPDKVIRLGATVGDWPDVPSPSVVIDSLVGSLEPVTPDAKLALPVTGQAVEAYRSGGETVTWLKGVQGLAVVAGEKPLRAVLVGDGAGKKLGVFPFSFKTRRPDMKDGWGTTPVEKSNSDARQMLSAWMIWLWRGKVNMKSYSL